MKEASAVRTSSCIIARRPATSKDKEACICSRGGVVAGAWFISLYQDAVSGALVWLAPVAFPRCKGGGVVTC